MRKKAAKRTLARLEGVEDASQISPMARFLAGGVGGVVSQCVQDHATRRRDIIFNIALQIFHIPHRHA